jgi:hypothetical protein
LLAELKNIGRGHPIEALVELTKILTKEDLEHLVKLFKQLIEAIDSSLI